jgi:hypothetical protein
VIRQACAICQPVTGFLSSMEPMANVPATTVSILQRTRTGKQAGGPRIIHKIGAPRGARMLDTDWRGITPVRPDVKPVPFSVNPCGWGGCRCRLSWAPETRSLPQFRSSVANLPDELHRQES